MLIYARIKKIEENYNITKNWRLIYTRALVSLNFHCLSMSNTLLVSGSSYIAQYPTMTNRTCLCSCSKSNLQCLSKEKLLMASLNISFILAYQNCPLIRPFISTLELTERIDQPSYTHITQALPSFNRDSIRSHNFFHFYLPQAGWQTLQWQSSFGVFLDTRECNSILPCPSLRQEPSSQRKELPDREEGPRQVIDWPSSS